MKTQYTLIDVATGEEFEDKGWCLGGASLVRANYENKKLNVGNDSEGLFKFRNWLPVNREIAGSNPPVTYKSEGLAKYLGLNNLYITFSGYFPKVGANMSTCAFKETEAYTVCSRMSDENKKVLVVASAGNTARAFAKVCSDNKIPLLLCVPEDNINALWFEKPLNECVKLLCTESGSDYFDAINLSNTVVKSDKFLAEGGAKNIARRDGMSTTMLSAVDFIGEIPDFYFQAIGSGTGAIAAWEANLRFIESGDYGNKKCKLLLSQNYPFLPMYEAWKANSREMLPYEDNLAREHAQIIDAKVLSNRKPPYGIAGGVYDALKDTDGDILVATNEELREAAQLFEELEGADIYSAAAVATASLIQAVKDDKIPADSIVMLNITGGGEKLFTEGKELFYLEPNRIFAHDFNEEEVLEYVNNLF